MHLYEEASVWFEGSGPAGDSGVERENHAVPMGTFDLEHAYQSTASDSAMPIHKDTAGTHLLAEG